MVQNFNHLYSSFQNQINFHRIALEDNFSDVDSSSSSSINLYHFLLFHSENKIICIISCLPSNYVQHRLPSTIFCVTPIALQSNYASIVSNTRIVKIYLCLSSSPLSDIDLLMLLLKP